ncbi:hypothetical protein H2Y54_09575 [Pectobacterium aroidearum]|uniref:hypothetical protein n=1 Tax=Pectobacterium aroidearum TaxID=1201031 RepID=UPI0015F0106A|nr:hypothetical protein [Pectobacterium aroidearum]MBA5236796.1 hypothetical protein [Pectobacterium aroidearum]
MQYAAALIEYIITGLVSLIWVFLLVSTEIDFTSFDYNKYKELIVIGIFPVSYVLGIYVDVTSSYFLRRFKNAGVFFKKYDFNNAFFIFFKKIFIGKPKGEPYARSAEILSYSPSDAIRTMEVYVSRDRIARGMALNSFITALVVLFHSEINEKLNPALIAFLITLVSVLAWLRLRRLSKAFKTQALIKLNERKQIKNGL